MLETKGIPFIMCCMSEMAIELSNMSHQLVSWRPITWTLPQRLEGHTPPTHTHTGNPYSVKIYCCMIFSQENVNEHPLTPDAAPMSGQTSNRIKVQLGKPLYLLGLFTKHGGWVAYRTLSEPKAASSRKSHTRMDDNFSMAAQMRSSADLILTIYSITSWDHEPM